MQVSLSLPPLCKKTARALETFFRKLILTWMNMHQLTKIKEGIFQVSLDLLPDALQHIIWAVALVPLEHYGKEENH